MGSSRIFNMVKTRKYNLPTPSNNGLPFNVRVFNAGHQADNASTSAQDSRRLKERERCLTPRVWPIRGGGIFPILLDVRMTRSNLERGEEGMGLK
jgi:hypothetical protein